MTAVIPPFPFLLRPLLGDFLFFGSPARF